MNNKLYPVTVRFTNDAWRAIKEISDNNNISMAETVRVATAGKLSQYLGTIRFIDETQGEEIRSEIKRLFGVVSQIQMELHRIGINYNQEVKIKQIEKKYPGTDFQSINQRYDEIQKIESECRGFSLDDLNKLMNIYVQATKRLGDVLCRIVV